MHKTSLDWIERSRNKYLGYFQTNGKIFSGVVVLSEKTFRFYINNPPKELRNSMQNGILKYVGNGWYSFLFKRQPLPVEAGIRRIERLLEESLSNKKRR